MTKEQFEKFSGDLIIENCESQSDGWLSTYSFSEVQKAIKLAYNKAIDDVTYELTTGDYGRQLELEAIDKLLRIE